MSLDSGPVPPRTPATVAPVGPSRFVQIVMRPMTKVLNPIISTLAGRRHVRMAAQLRHTGRRSGRAYTTPVGARRSGHAIVIPLTFGNQSDWARNVRAAGGCSIRLNGQDYAAEQPEFLGREQAEPLVREAFSSAERASFGMLGIRQFLRLRIVPGRP